MGKSIVHIGPNSAGQVAKACNQMVMLIALQGLAETFAFARKNGLDSARVYEALSGGGSEDSSQLVEVIEAYPKADNITWIAAISTTAFAHLK